MLYHVPDVSAAVRELRRVAEHGAFFATGRSGVFACR